MTLIAKHAGQCANCGKRIPKGDPIDYIAPSGNLPARVEHPVCPEPKPQRVTETDTLFTFRACAGCGHEWAIPRHMHAATVERFNCAYCQRAALLDAQDEVAQAMEAA